MLHFVARARRGRLLFVDWTEARALWDRTVRGCPGLLALVLMPDHLHLLHELDVRDRLAQAIAACAQWRNRRRGERGPLVERLPAADRALQGDKRARALRYVHLNPCRARLVDDPLSWPFSTHRDAVGLATFPVVPAHPDPTWFHAYVSSDPTVRVDGTELPTWSVATTSAAQVLHAVSASTRTPLPAVACRGSARSLYLRAARTLTADPHATIGLGVGVSRSAVLGSPAREDARVRAVARVIGDPRLAPLYDGDLRPLPAWRRYRDRA